MQRKHDVTEIENLTNFGFTVNQTCSPISQNHATEGSPNFQCEADVENRQLKKTIVTLRQNLGERTNQLQAKMSENTKLKAEVKKPRGINSKRNKDTVKLIRAKDTLLKEKIMLRTELSEMRKSVKKQDNSPYPATAIPVQTESSDSENDWQYVYRNRKQKLRYKPTIKSSSKSSSSAGVSSSDNSSDRGGTSVSNCNERRRTVCASKIKQVHPQRNKIIPNKTQPENRDNKKETHLPDASTVQDRPIKNKCVVGDSSMRGLATQLKAKLKNPETVCVYKTSGMKIANLTTRLPGYVNKDTEAVIIHLGTNDIGGQANKAIQDINELTQKMKTLHNTHYPV